MPDEAPLWLCVDPGETTGWSIWSGTTMLEAGQTALWEFIDDVDLTLSAEPGMQKRRKANCPRAGKIIPRGFSIIR